MSGPLDGFRVVDLTSAVLGPVATQVLGDMGADVIKVEVPGGDFMRQLGPARHAGMAAYFLNINRNKRSVVLDLKSPTGHAALLDLIASADVFVHNMRLSAIDRLGLDYASVAVRNPRIVYAAATGFDRMGPDRDRPAYDDVIQGEAGFAWLNASIAGEPRFVPMAICDKLVGHMLASAVGMGLACRERTGIGQEVHVPMLESIIAFNMVEHLWHGVLDEPEKGLGYPRMFTPHRRPYPTKDGYVCLLATTDQQWGRLFGALGRPELAKDARFATLAARTGNIDSLYSMVVEQMRERTTAEWLERLEHADVPHGTVASLQDIVDNPTLRESGFLQRVEHPTEGAMMTMGVTTRFSRTPGALRLPPPGLGEHTASVFAALGYSEAQIATLSAQAADSSSL
jgi:crotonobetainyl-CoA:carnitine CoA-transferase CaiB-like acyl-CoA transferase